MAKYIDADMVKSGITELIQNAEARKRILYEGLAELMDDLPAADVAAVKHGEWLNPHHTPYVTCSLCGGTVATNWKGFYCQNCGARMDGGGK